MDIGVHLQVQGVQQALVYLDSRDVPHTNSLATAAKLQADPKAATALGKAGGADPETQLLRISEAAKDLGARGGHFIGRLGHPHGHEGG